MACFADINVSQGSVATYARCGGSFDIHFTANYFTKESSSDFFTSVKNWHNYGHESVVPFFWPTLYRLFGPETGVNFFSFFVFAFPYMILALSTSWLMLVCVLVGPRLYYSRYLSWIVRPTSRIFHSSSGESLISLTELPFGLRARWSDAIFMRLLYWRRFCLPGTKTFSTIGSFTRFVDKELDPY